MGKKIYADEYMEGDVKWLRNMRDRGFCAVCFTPEELDGVDPDALDDALTQYGLEAIEDMKEDDDEEF